MNRTLKIDTCCGICRDYFCPFSDDHSFWFGSFDRANICYWTDSHFSPEKLGLISVTVYLLLGLIRSSCIFRDDWRHSCFIWSNWRIFDWISLSNMANWLDDPKNRRSLLIRNLCQSNGLSYRISLWDDRLEDKWRPYFYNCICQWSTAFLLPEAIKAIGAAYIGVLMKKRLNRFLPNELSKKQHGRRLNIRSLPRCLIFNLNRSFYFVKIYFYRPVNNYPTRQSVDANSPKSNHPPIQRKR